MHDELVSCENLYLEVGVEGKSRDDRCFVLTGIHTLGSVTPTKEEGIRIYLCRDR